MSETPETPVEEPTPETTAGTAGPTETTTGTEPAPAFGLGTGPTRSADGSEAEPTAYKIGDEDFSDLPVETRAELGRNAGRTLSTDSAGVDRVVSQHATDWEPAPVDPDPKVVEHTERVQAALEAARAERTERLGLQQQAAADQGDAVSAGQGA